MGKTPDNRRQYAHGALAGFVFTEPHQNSVTAACSLSPAPLSPLPSLAPPHPFLVAYAWQVVADVTRNDADGTHSHTEWKRS